MKSMYKNWLKVAMIAGMAVAGQAQARMAEVVDDISPQEMLEIAKKYGKAMFLDDSGEVGGSVEGSLYVIFLRNVIKMTIVLHVVAVG